MKKNLNVLSIDFDFFQEVTPETIMKCYPDTGMELPEKIVNLIWSERYKIAEYRNKLFSVTMNTEKLDTVKKIIKKSYVSSNGVALKPVAEICRNHKEIYEFIVQNYNKEIYKNISIAHIDMHPDIDNRNNRLDNGNWIKFLIKKYPETKIQWYANTISKQTYVNEETTTKLEKDIVERSIINNFDNIKNQQFDLIFLCRSDEWLPLHLDSYFVELAKYTLMHCRDCKCEKNIFKVRKLI